MNKMRLIEIRYFLFFSSHKHSLDIIIQENNINYSQMFRAPETATTTSE